MSKTRVDGWSGTAHSRRWLHGLWAASVAAAAVMLVPDAVRLAGWWWSMDLPGQFLRSTSSLGLAFMLALVGLYGVARVPIELGVRGVRVGAFRARRDQVRAVFLSGDQLVVERHQGEPYRSPPLKLPKGLDAALVAYAAMDPPPAPESPGEDAARVKQLARRATEG